MVNPDPILPLILLDSHKNPRVHLLMNTKGYHKSLENNELWVVHPVTGRLLPLNCGAFESLTRQELFYTSAVSSAFLSALEAPLAELTQVVKAAAQASGSLETDSGDSETQNNNTAPNPAPGSTTVLHSLSRIIKQRRADMPEGSYTTHLFQKGPEKIRKKTGEEAIELLLAQSSKEIVYEAADLMYHMMVLLEVSSLGIDQVLSELETRLGQ